MQIKYQLKNQKELSEEIISVADYVDVMSVKAKGKRINQPAIKKVKFAEPLPYDEPEEIDEVEEIEDLDQDNEISAPQSIDEEVAKEIFEIIEPRKETKKQRSEEDDSGEQLALFD